MAIPKKLQPTIDTLPDLPGCYIMKNAKGKVIYVGKAKVLKNRVRSYFHNNAQHDDKTRMLVKNIASIEWIVVGSELEALILEMNLIKKHRPQYNIRLKDDKRYPYIKIHWAMDFPRVTVTRQMAQDGNRYYGPYTSAWAVHQTLDVLRRIFPYLTCDRTITGTDTRACLYYDIKLCSGPCIGAIDKEAYRKNLDEMGDFLNGYSDQIIFNLQKEMQQASEELHFEKAAAIRDKLKAIDRIIEQQKIISVNRTDSDIIAMARDKNEACVQIFFIRNGKLIGREYFILEGAEEANEDEIISGFVKQFYKQAAKVPDEIILPNQVEESKVIEEWLNTSQHSDKIRLEIPRSHEEQELVEMAALNATETLRALKQQWENDTNRQQNALADLQKYLKLEEPPNRIECYDISHTQGTAMVGSMVVFEQGVPSKRLYRRFNVKSVHTPDDFAAMEEVLTRRFRRWQGSQEESKTGKKIDPSFGVLPDLLIVDGGKGQLSRAVQVLEQFDLQGKISAAGLAKQQEEVFLPNRSRSILLPRNAQGLYLLQRIRDEAHRSAITAHRRQSSKQGIASRLDTIPGIGPAKRNALLKVFGSIDAIKDASIPELAAVNGINENLAYIIKNSLE
ncbi:MAG: excinuclease ABC subunit UvrC [Anaerolineaceae bacterium]|nr:excinuclease ABC subunit UvrC [Anaerolineaceae bacterium]